MEHYRLVEEFDTLVATSYVGFEISPTQRERNTFSSLSGTLSALWIYGDTLNGANALTVRVTEDEDGDKCIIADTQVGIAQGLTTTTKTSSVIKIEIDVADTWPSKVWVKTDTGSVNVRQVKITWRV
tara:strand:- start:705 stop:1085 length:381 start_codon:yes stop_codon:yes gene_type:complete